MKIFKWVAMAALVSTTPALAADFEAAEPFSWTGLYVGAYAGYAWGDGMLDNTFCRLNPVDCGGTYFVDPEVDGFIGGGLIGYNQQFDGGFVLGAEIDLGIGPSGDGEFEGSGFVGPNPDFTGEIDVGLSGSARLRAGFAIDRFMPFITGGVAFATYDADMQGPDVNDDDTRSGDGSLVGWTVGGGLNYAVTDNIILGAEYRYTDFGSDTVGLTSSADTDIWSHEVELQTHDIRATASFKF